MKGCFVSNSRMSMFIILAFMLILLHKPLFSAIDDFLSPQPWFSVDFQIPNYEEGEDPIVIYNTDIKHNLYGEWVTSIYRISNDGTTTYRFMGTGSVFYDEDENVTLDMPLSVFMHDRCKLPPAKYKACAFYKLEDNHGSGKAFNPFCSGFKVAKRKNEQ